MNGHDLKIKYGELHIYYPLKFETKQKYVDVCKVIEQSKIFFHKNIRKKLRML